MTLLTADQMLAVMFVEIRSKLILKMAEDRGCKVDDISPYDDMVMKTAMDITEQSFLKAIREQAETDPRIRLRREA